jgi:hypothetical protein
MTHQRRKLVQTFILAAVVALALPIVAAAQGNYNPYGRQRDYGRNDDRRYDYNRRVLRDSVRRVKDRSNDFKKHLDSALDHSRYDGRRREDRINDQASDFHNAADRLKDRYDDGRDLNRSAEDARNLLQIAARLDRFVERNPLSGRALSDWSAIRQDLRVIANAYGFRMGDFNDGYNRPGNDGYRRRSSYPQNNNDSWYRQFPF